MNYTFIILVALLYLGVIFGIAYYAERQLKKGINIINNGWVYALSMAVYCTAWTYYGSVGRASLKGMDFLAVYIGPTIACCFFWPVLRKMLRICKVMRINSIADFIATRYGKNVSLGVIVTLFCIIGLVPYIALQLKAISNSIHLLFLNSGHESSVHYAGDITYLLVFVLSIFIILFGTRSVDASERHVGLVASVAFESVLKLAAFITAGIYITYSLFNGLDDIFSQATHLPQAKDIFTFSNTESISSWLTILVISGFATILLPRQFQISMVENVQEQHLKKAIWVFPLYLIIINIFVLPIAVAGLLTPEINASPDTYILSLPLLHGKHWLSLFIFLGGFSAAISMVIVETIALSTMVSNHLILPLLFSSNIKSIPEGYLRTAIINSRRLSIFLLLLIAYYYDKLLAQESSLVSIGLMSFAAVAQFAPAVLGGLFWKQGNRKGAVAGIIIGFLVWSYTLILPSSISSLHQSNNIITEGPWGITWLRPNMLFGIEIADPLSHSFFWSILLNISAYCLVSIYTGRNAQEAYQAELFVDIFNHTTVTTQNSFWKGTAYMDDIRTLLEKFIGKDRSEKLLTSYANRHKLSLQTAQADTLIVAFTERVLSGVIGSASARTMIKSVTKEEAVSMSEVLNIAKESQQVLELNKELRKKSTELTKASELLKKSNEQLKSMDVMKDEFLSTVTHELRTPLTSIRAMSEILYDNPDMPEEMRNKYLSSIVKETERLSQLIGQVLNLERYESGRQKLNISAVNIAELIQDVITSLNTLIEEKHISMSFYTPDTMHIQQCDKDLLRQVVYNLISNAIKFVPEQNGKIDVRMILENDDLIIRVIDNGKGIEPELHQLIFDKFFQAKNQTLRKPQGTGLGLAISKKIVELHGGKIWVESQPSEGATFIIVLPIYQS